MSQPGHSVLRWAAVGLLAGGAASAATLSVGSANATADQGEITLPISVSSAQGDNPSVLQFDILYDEQAMSLPDVAVGAAAAGANKTVNAVEYAPGVVRVMVAGFNQDAIANGVALEAFFEVNPDVSPADYNVALGRVVMSDPYGNPLHVETEHGAVRVADAEVSDTPLEEDLDAEGEKREGEWYEEDELSDSTTDESTSTSQPGENASHATSGTTASNNDRTNSDDRDSTRYLGYDGYGWGHAGVSDGGATGAGPAGAETRSRVSSAPPSPRAALPDSGVPRVYGGSTHHGAASAPEPRSAPSVPAKIYSASNTARRSTPARSTPSGEGQDRVPAVMHHEVANPAAPGRQIAMAVPGGAAHRNAANEGWHSPADAFGTLVVDPGAGRRWMHGLPGAALGLFGVCFILWVRALVFRGIRTRGRKMG